MTLSQSRCASLLRRWRRKGLGPSRTRQGISYADPLHAGRHPFQVYLLALCVVSGTPLVLGLVEPRTIEAALPGWLATAWGIFLLTGAAVALVGSYWQGDYANALTLERIGLVLVGSAAVIYGVVIFTVLDWAGFVSACITAGFGVSCLSRARDIGHIIQTAIVDLKADGS